MGWKPSSGMEESTFSPSCTKSFWSIELDPQSVPLGTAAFGLFLRSHVAESRSTCPRSHRTGFGAPLGEAPLHQAAYPRAFSLLEQSGKFFVRPRALPN